jgi:TolA-binding protein
MVIPSRLGRFMIELSVAIGSAIVLVAAASAAEQRQSPAIDSTLGHPADLPVLIAKGGGGSGGSGGGSGGGAGGAGAGGAGGGAGGAGGGGAGGSGAGAGAGAGAAGAAGSSGSAGADGSASGAAGSDAGGDGATSAAPGLPSSPTIEARLSSLLVQAETELARGNFTQAQRHGETVLQNSAPAATRGRALLVVADAAFAQQSYRIAATRYGQFVSEQPRGPDAARAAMALGWAHLRQGDREQARQAWARFADAHPADARAPLALALGAELAGQAGDTATSRRLLDRILTHHPSSPHAATARLSRSGLALRRQHEDEALRDLDEVIRNSGASALEQRRRLHQALSTPGAEARLESATPPASGDRTLEAIARLLLDARRREPDPYPLHGLVLLAARERGWSDSLTTALASRLLDEFPAYAAAPPALARVAASAASAGQWPLARRAYDVLLARAPAAAMDRKTRLASAEAQLRTGATTQARAQLEQLAATGGEDATRALFLLAELHTAAGDRGAGRAALRRVVERSGGEAAAEAGYRLGELARADGQHAAAVESYVKAAHTARSSRWARLALLGAGTSLTALHEPQKALATYWQLIPRRPGVDAVADREVSGEAAYRAGEILRGAGLPKDALDMFVISAHLTGGSAAERRALVGAVQCLVATGDRESAEKIYRRLADSGGTEPALLAQARQALGVDGGPSPGARRAAESAPPKDAR